MTETHHDRRQRFLASVLTIGMDHARGLKSYESSMEALSSVLPEARPQSDVPHPECIEAVLGRLWRQVGGGEGTCRKCGSPIYFFPTRAGKVNPISQITGVSHFADCPAAERFRKAAQR